MKAALRRLHPVLTGTLLAAAGVAAAAMLVSPGTRR